MEARPAEAESSVLPETASNGETKNPSLVALGERVRGLRARRGLTRKTLAQAADISERYLANLEYGVGNASILVLLQVAGALRCPLAELIGDVSTSSPEWLLIREQLEQCDEATLRRVRVAIGEMMGTGGANAQRSSRVALIGLRGAGKSTLGRMLAEDLSFPFVELSREIEKFAGCSVAEIQEVLLLLAMYCGIPSANEGRSRCSARSWADIGGERTVEEVRCSRVPELVEPSRHHTAARG